MYEIWGVGRLGEFLLLGKQDIRNGFRMLMRKSEARYFTGLKARVSVFWWQYMESLGWVLGIVRLQGGDGCCVHSLFAFAFYFPVGYRGRSDGYHCVPGSLLA